MQSAVLEVPVLYLPGRHKRLPDQISLPDMSRDCLCRSAPSFPLSAACFMTRWACQLCIFTKKLTNP